MYWFRVDNDDIIYEDTKYKCISLGGKKMFMMEEVLNERYQKIFDNTYMFTKKKIEEDPSYGVNQLEALLESLYINEGNDLLGRGELYDLSIKAQIAACEILMQEIKN